MSYLEQSHRGAGKGSPPTFAGWRGSPPRPRWNCSGPAGSRSFHSVGEEHTEQGGFRSEIRGPAGWGGGWIGSLPHMYNRRRAGTTGRRRGASRGGRGDQAAAALGLVQCEREDGGVSPWPSCRALYGAQCPQNCSQNLSGHLVWKKRGKSWE